MIITSFSWQMYKKTSKILKEEIINKQKKHQTIYYTFFYNIFEYSPLFFIFIVFGYPRVLVIYIWGFRIQNQLLNSFKGGKSMFEFCNEKTAKGEEYSFCYDCNHFEEDDCCKNCIYDED